VIARIATFEGGDVEEMRRRNNELLVDRPTELPAGILRVMVLLKDEGRWSVISFFDSEEAAHRRRGAVRTDGRRDPGKRPRQARQPRKLRSRLRRGDGQVGAAHYPSTNRITGTLTLDYDDKACGPDTPSICINGITYANRSVWATDFDKRQILRIAPCSSAPRREADRCALCSPVPGSRMYAVSSSRRPGYL
jgi:hypothetical protein